MAATRLASSGVEDLLRRPDSARRAIRLLTRAEAIGLVEPADTQGSTIFVALLDALQALESAGVGRGPVRAVLAGDADLGVLDAIDEAMVSSPLPSHEWPAMTEALGESLLIRLLATSVTSGGRYRRRERPTPDDVAARLHYLALVVADLAGTYNQRGVRRWFLRPRPQLDGRAPADLLSGQWDPDEAGPRHVAKLAAVLVGAGWAT